MGARMLAQDYGEHFAPGSRWIILAVHLLGMTLYVLAAILTVTSGVSYFRRHGHFVLE